MKLHQTILAVSLGLFFTGCKSNGSRNSLPAYTPDIAVTEEPFADVHANWKQRLDQPYVFLEHQGDYRIAGKRFTELHGLLAERDIAVAGPPFILFYDDPSAVPVDQLRSRVCLPVAGAVSAQGKLRYEVLPSTTVVYAVVSGPYPETPRAYPGMYRYLESMHWVENGPLREIYLVRPDATGNWDELLCEIQIPATQSR